MDKAIGTLDSVAKCYSAKEYASLKRQKKTYGMRLQCHSCSATAVFRRAYKRDGKPETKACFAATHRSTCEYAVRIYRPAQVPGRPASPVIKIKLATVSTVTSQEQKADNIQTSDTAGKTSGASGNRTKKAITPLKELLGTMLQPSFDRLNAYLEYLDNAPVPVAECLFPLTGLGREHKGAIIGCWGRIVGTGTNKQSVWLHSGKPGSGLPQIAIRNPQVVANVLAAARRKNFDFATSMYVIAFGEIRSSRQSLYCDVLHENNIAFLKAFD